MGEGSTIGDRENEAAGGNVDGTSALATAQPPRRTPCAPQKHATSTAITTTKACYMLPPQPSRQQNHGEAGTGPAHTRRHVRAVGSAPFTSALAAKPGSCLFKSTTKPAAASAKLAPAGAKALRCTAWGKLQSGPVQADKLTPCAGTIVVGDGNSRQSGSS